MDNVKISIIGEIQSSENSFEIILKSEYKDALTGLDGFSHLHILWWADQVDAPEYRKITVTDKPYKQGPDIMGLFATRSPLRPNPVAVTVVYITDIDYEKGILYTPYIDAEPGTPVLDIKPYIPCADIVRDFTVPEWCSRWPENIEDSADFDWGSVFNFNC